MRSYRQVGAGMSGSVKPCVVVPALDAASTLPYVLESLRAELPELRPRDFFVVDDGSLDGTATAARAASATLVRHEHNLGKGASLRTGFRAASAHGFTYAVTVDADGQHPAKSVRKVFDIGCATGSLALGVRDLAREGAPRANQFSNAVSNFFLSLFSGRKLLDTQCGLRGYPIGPCLNLGAAATGYAFEGEVLLRAVAKGLPIVEVPVRVVYPPEGERITHFHSVKDPLRIIRMVVTTTVELSVRRAAGAVVSTAA